MKLPDLPRKGEAVEKTVTDIIRYLRATRITSFMGGRVEERPGGTTLVADAADKKKAPPFLHPFKVMTNYDGSDLKCFVNYGQVSLAKLNSYVSYPDTNGSLSTGNVTIGGDALCNHPSGAAPGFIALSADTEYGVWLKGYYIFQSASVNFWGLSGTTGRGFKAIDECYIIFDRVEAETAYLAPNTAPSNSEVWLFLGKVSVDSNYRTIIHQYWKSDILLQSFFVSNVNASSDSGNSFAFGTDGLPFVHRIVSNDSSNSISVGSDGGAFYDAP
jgi:hypothetical protein